ncbi:MAG: DUF3592 domain-containing protein [Bacteroidota bacterium]
MNQLNKSPYFMFIIGLAALAFAVYSYKQQTKFLENSKETTGTVIDVKVQKTSDTGSMKNRRFSNKTSYVPVVEFYTEDSTRIEFKSSSGSSNFDTYKTGKKVAVLYNPDDPTYAQLKSKSNKTTAYISAGGGLLFIIIGLVTIIMKKRKKII